MGSDITQHLDYSITFSQEKKLDDVNPQVLLDVNGKGSDGVGTPDQATMYQYVVRKMFFICATSAALRPLHNVISLSKLIKPRCHHLHALDTTLKHFKTNPAALQCLAPIQNTENTFSPYIFSDGAKATAGEVRRRSGHIIFRHVGQVLHPIQWSHRKLRRESRINATSEVLSAVEALLTGLYMRDSIIELCGLPKTELLVD